MSDQPRLRGALKAITAAVVGVILNLSLWFALHVLFSDVQQERLGLVTLWRPNLASIEWLAVALFGLSALMAFWLHWGIIRVLAIASLVCCILHLLL